MKVSKILFSHAKILNVFLQLQFNSTKKVILSEKKAVITHHYPIFFNKLRNTVTINTPFAF